MPQFPADESGYLEERVRRLEIWSARAGDHLTRLQALAEKEDRMLATLHDAMTDIAHRTNRLEDWRKRDEPLIKAAHRADELADLLAAHLKARRDRGWRYWTRLGAIGIGLISIGAFVAQVIQVITD